MYFYASLLAAVVITLLVVSRVAEMLHAKHYSMQRVFAASLLGAAVAALASLLLSVFVQGVDPMVMMILSISVMFVASSAAFKYINKMSWSGAITTNIANIAVMLIGLTAAVVLNGRSFDDTIASITSTTQNNVSMVKGAADTYKEGGDVLAELQVAQQLEEEDGFAEESEFDDDNMDAKVTEKDLLLPAAVNEMKQIEKKVYVEPKYYSVSIGSLNSLVGKPIRILRANGSTVAGALKKISGSDAYVAQRLRSGVATTPVAIAKIRKLEVYR